MCGLTYCGMGPGGATWPCVCWGTMLELGWGSGTAWKAAASHFFQNLRVAWSIGLCSVPQKIGRLIRFIDYLPQIVTRAERPFCIFVWSVSLWKQSAIWDTVPHSCVWVQNSIEIEWTPLISQFADGCMTLTTISCAVVRGQGGLRMSLIMIWKFDLQKLCGRFKNSWSEKSVGHFLFKSWVHV